MSKGVSQIFVAFSLFLLTGPVQAQEFHGTMAKPEVVEIKDIFKDPNVEFLNLVFVSVVTGALFKENHGYYHVVDLRKTIQSPTKVSAQILGSLPGFRGLRIGIKLDNPDFRKILASGQDVLSLQLNAEFLSCDGDSFVETSDIRSSEKILEVLKNIEYNFNPQANCKFNITSVILSDSSNVGQLSRATDVFFAAESALVGNVFRLDTWKNSESEPRENGSVISMNLLSDSRIIFQNHFYRENAISEKMVFDAKGITLLRSESSVRLNEKYANAVASVSKVVSFLNSYRSAIVVSSSLESAQRSAFLSDKIKKVSQELQKDFSELNSNLKVIDFPQKVLAIRIIRQAMEDLNRAEIQMNLVNSSYPGISSLNISDKIK